MRRFGVLAFALLCAVQTLLAANKQAETFNMQKAYEAFQNQDYQTAVDCLNKELADDAKTAMPICGRLLPTQQSMIMARC